MPLQNETFPVTKYPKTLKTRIPPSNLKPSTELPPLKVPSFQVSHAYHPQESATADAREECDTTDDEDLVALGFKGHGLPERTRRGPFTILTVIKGLIT